MDGRAAKYVWQDREIRFDIAPQELRLRKGEEIVDWMNSVEDTKGNNGERGSLSVTNLRLLWSCHKNYRTNLSIGYACVQSMTIRTTTSRLRGKTQALHLMTKFNKSRFEFIFTSLVLASPRLFTTVQSVFRAYETSKLYRDLKLRGAVVRDKQLILLPHEEVFSKFGGVWNLSSDQGNLGTFFVTNVRLVWHADLAENFNVSIPYMQMRTIRVRDSRFGLALVIETMPQAGGYMLGFRVDPAEQLERVHKELVSMHQVFSANPIFGVDFKTEEAREDDVQIEDSEVGNDVLAAYYAEAAKEKDREPVFDDTLGLAVERLPPGYTVDKLWRA